MKKVYMSESVGPNSRGRPLVRWRDKVKEYMCEYMCERGATRGGGLDQAKGVYGQGKVEIFLPWSHPWGRFLEGARL